MSFSQKQTKNKYKQYHCGQSLVEILFALGIATIAISIVAYLVLSAQSTVRQELSRVKATALAEEGIAAARSIAGSSFDNVSEGAHGLVVSGDEWILSGTSDSWGNFTRVITFSEVRAGLYQVTATVSWTPATPIGNSVSRTSYIANWEQTAGKAGDARFDVSAIAYTDGGKNIEGVTLENIHTSQNFITSEVIVSWDGPAALSDFSINGSLVYTASTSGLIYSGDTMDIVDTLFVANTGAIAFGPMVFTESMSTTTVHIAVVLEDGSKRYVHVIP